MDDTPKKPSRFFAALSGASLVVMTMALVVTVMNIQKSQEAKKSNAGSSSSPVPIVRKVWILNYDPVVTNNDTHVTDVASVAMGWNKAIDLSNEFIQKITAASHGNVVYQIVNATNPSDYTINKFPIKETGYTLTPSDWWNCNTIGKTYSNHCEEFIDYKKLIQDPNQDNDTTDGICKKIDDGVADEIWIFGGPYFGYQEFVYDGKFVNGIADLNNICKGREYALMGFNSAMGISSMFHSMGHRTENMLSIPGIYNYNIDTPGFDLNNPWSMYTLYNNKALGKAGCGNVHIPANGNSQYDYGSTVTVDSTCDDWMNYPNLTGAKKSTNNSAWNTPPYESFEQYWMAHLPHLAGFTNGKLNDWWSYVVDYDNAINATQYGCMNQSDPRFNRYAIFDDGSCPTSTPTAAPTVVPTTVPTAAPVRQDGVCGTTLNTCNPGDLGPTSDLVDKYEWWCIGRNGGTDASCNILKPPTPAPIPGLLPCVVDPNNPGPKNFCPNDSVTRAMASVFILRVKFVFDHPGQIGSGYEVPVTTKQSFADVPLSFWGHDYIEQFNTDGFTGGCGGGNFCPDQTVKQDQMAVFLLRAEHGTGYTPPTPASYYFTDIQPGYWARDWIEQAHSEGIMKGCNENAHIFCPGNEVPRSEMAKYLLIGEHSNTYSAPAITDNISCFADVAPSNQYASWIRQLAGEGITAGCGPANMNNSNKEVILPKVAPTPTPISGSCGASINSCRAGFMSSNGQTTTAYQWWCSSSNNGANVLCNQTKPTPTVAPVPKVVATPTSIPTPTPRVATPTPIPVVVLSKPANSPTLTCGNYDAATKSFPISISWPSVSGAVNYHLSVTLRGKTSSWLVSSWLGNINSYSIPVGRVAVEPGEKSVSISANYSYSNDFNQLSRSTPSNNVLVNCDVPAGVPVVPTTKPTVAPIPTSTPVVVSKTPIPVKTSAPIPTIAPIVTPVATTQTMLILNPSFEIDTNADKYPDSWTSNKSFTRSTLLKHSGVYSGRHYSTANVSYNVDQTKNNIVANKTYSFSGWTNIPATDDSFTYSIQLIWKGGFLGLFTLRTDTIKTYQSSTNGWVQAVASKTAPSNSKSVTIRMKVTSLNANVYVDDFSLK